MQENEKKATESKWNDVEKYLASEIVAGAKRESAAKNFGMIVMAVVLCGIISGLIFTNRMQTELMYENDSHWRQTIEKNNQNWIDYLSQYDFVTQDGEGINYYNSDVGGNVNNGPTSQAAEEPKEN